MPCPSDKIIIIKTKKGKRRVKDILFAIKVNNKN